MGEEREPVPLPQARLAIGWQIVITTGIGFMGAVLLAFWQLADPRAEIKTLRDLVNNQYLTIREHVEFSAKVQRDLDRLSAEQTRQVSTDAFNAWKIEHDAAHKDLQKRIEALQLQLHQHERDDRAWFNGPSNSGVRK